MRMQHRRTILWMELCSYVPLLLRNLYYLHQIGGWVDTHTLHTVLLIFLFEFVVELVAMTMPLLDRK